MFEGPLRTKFKLKLTIISMDEPLYASQITMTTGWLLLLLLVVSSQSVGSQSLNFVGKFSTEIKFLSNF